MRFNVNFENKLGKIKAMNAVGQPPKYGISDTYMHYLSEAHIPYSRLHDVAGPFGGGLYVDIPNIFRDFDADPYNPESYDFAFTDILIKQLIAEHCEPIYRLGVTIENYQYIRAYRVYPPKDFKKWAVICEHIIRHYNEGWADGFNYGIKYWEIWNEPDNGYDPKDNQMWQGTMEEFFELYEVASKHLKRRFGDTIKVGGFASCGFYSLFDDPAKPNRRNNYFTEFALKFLDFVKETDSPMDFFSYHSYASVEGTVMMADFIDEELTKRGFGDVETQINEWNNAASLELRGTAEAAAKAAAMMLTFQNKKTTTMCYYDARLGPSVYGGMFNPMNHQPLPAYYSFMAFGELYVLGNQLALDSGDNALSAIAATDDSGEKYALMIANTGDDAQIETNLKDCKVRIVDEEHNLTEIEVDSSSFTLGKYQTALISNY